MPTVFNAFKVSPYLNTEYVKEQAQILNLYFLCGVHILIPVWRFYPETTFPSDLQRSAGHHLAFCERIFPPKYRGVRRLLKAPWCTPTRRHAVHEPRGGSFCSAICKAADKWSMKWRYLKRPDTKASPTSNDSGNEPNSMLLFLLLVSEPTESVSSGAGRGLVGVCISYLVYYLRWPSAELNVSLLMSQRMDV